MIKFKTKFWKKLNKKFSALSYVKLICYKILFLLFITQLSAAKETGIQSSLLKKENTKNFILKKTKRDDPKIIITGNIRIDDNTILSLIDAENIILKKGDYLTSSLKKLYSSGLFSKVDIIYHQNYSEIRIVENPLILEVKIVGNKKIDDDILKNELSSKKGAIFSKPKLENDLKRINEIYIKSGRFLTNIEPKLIQKEQNRVEVVFDIYEGKKAKINKINFIGNKAFSDKELRSELSTKETKWYKFLSSSDSYDSDRIEYDKERLRRFYNSNGYADFTTISAIAQINQQKDKFDINFLVDEGIKYKFGKVKIINQIKNFKKENLLEKQITIKNNKVYDFREIEKTIDNMVNVLNQNSYAFADIEPEIDKDKDKKNININFILKETPNIYIRNIITSGNSHTHTKVILRELRIKEGDPYNIIKINRSKQLLQNLNFFEKVEFLTEKVPNSNQVDLIIEITERKTGEMNLGIGYSTVDSLTTNIGIRERNLLGTGRDLSLNLQKSYSGISSEVSYNKPYFLDLPLNAGFDIFNYQLYQRNSLSYDQTTQGFSLRAGYSISEYLYHNISYSLRGEKISNLSSDASLSIKSIEGKFVTSKISQGFLYDRRDNSINTTSGYYLSLNQEYSGLGGNIKNIKHEGSAAYYKPIVRNDFIFKLSGRFGFIQGINQDVKSNYGFFLGGNNFRGFQYAGIGPRAKAVNSNSFVGGNIIGGKNYYTASAELQFPLGLPKEFDIKGILFSDNGTVYGVDLINKENSEVIDDKSIRSSYGLSIAWSSPMGPIRLDFSRIAKKEYYDQSQNFRFSFGTSF